MTDYTPEEIRALVQNVASALAHDETEQAENEGGFVDAPNTDSNPVTNVFLVRDRYDHGYLLEGQGDNAEQIPLPEIPDQDRRGEASKGVEGRIVSVEHKLTDGGQYDPRHKLRVRLEYTVDGKKHDFLLHTGFFTNTAKSLLSNLSAIEGELKDRLVTIMMDPARGENANKNVLFTDVFTEEGLVMDSEWPENDQVVIDLFDSLRERLGQEPLEEDRPQPREEKESGGNSSRSSSSDNGRSNGRSSGRSRNRSARSSDDGERNGRRRSTGRSRGREKPRRR